MFVFDTSAYLNGANHHYFLDTMGGVWTLVEESIDSGAIIVPREVYREVVMQRTRSRRCSEGIKTP